MNQFERIHLYVSMFITISGIGATFYPQWLNYFGALMIGYLVGGCFIDKDSLFVHHVLCISALVFWRTYLPTTLDSYLICFVNCEYSSVFYNGWPIIDDLIERYRPDLSNTALTKYGKTVFDVGFLVTFIKFRIWDISAKMVLNPLFYSWHNAVFGNNTALYIYFNLNVFAFYLLNMYWFLIIIKKIVKPLLRSFNTYLLCEFLAQYSSYLPFVLAFIAYYHNGMFDTPAIIHCQGLVVFAYGCWTYHRALYLRIKKDGDSIDCLECGEQLKMDALCSNIHVISTFISWGLYYYLKYRVIVFIGFVFVLSSCCVSRVCTVTYIDNLRKTGKKFLCDTTTPARYYLHILMLFPTFISSIYYVIFIALIGVEYGEVITTAYIVLIMYLAEICIIKMEPFYKLSHVAVHLVIAWHHYYIASININIRNRLQ